MLRVVAWILLILIGLVPLTGCSSESLPTAGQDSTELVDFSDLDEALGASTRAFNQHFPEVTAKAETFRSAKDLPLDRLSPQLTWIVGDYGTFIESKSSGRGSAWVLFTSETHDQVLVHWCTIRINEEEGVLLTMLK